METDTHIPPPEPAAINPVDNFGNLVNSVCDLVNPRFERIENALTNVDTQFKLLHETLAKLAEPAARTAPPLTTSSAPIPGPPPVPRGGTFSWDDAADDQIWNNPYMVPIKKLVNEGYNPFTLEEIAQ